MIEAWGRGIERIMEACLDAKTPEPELMYEPAGLAVVFPFPEAYWGSTTHETRVKTPVETRVKTPVAVLELLRANPRMSLADAAREIGKSLSAVERAAARLTAEGRLRHVGPKRGGRWEVLK